MLELEHLCRVSLNIIHPYMEVWVASDRTYQFSPPKVGCIPQDVVVFAIHQAHVKTCVLKERQKHSVWLLCVYAQHNDRHAMFILSVKTVHMH